MHCADGLHIVRIYQTFFLVMLVTSQPHRWVFKKYNYYICIVYCINTSVRLRGFKSFYISHRVSYIWLCVIGLKCCNGLTNSLQATYCHQTNWQHKTDAQQTIKMCSTIKSVILRFTSIGPKNTEKSSRCFANITLLSYELSSFFQRIVHKSLYYHI